MGRDGEIPPNRLLGIPWSPGQRGRPEEEEQRVLGVPVSGYGSVDLDLLQSLARPFQRYRRWAGHRRLGPGAPDEGEPDRQD
jgi:hypothetical protein